MVRDVETRDGVAVIALAGDLDLYNANKFRQATQKLWDDGLRKVVVDLADLRYVDSSGIGVMLHLFTSAQKRNGYVRYANVHGSVLKVITLTKLERFLPIVADVKSAITELRDLQDEVASGERFQGIQVDDNHRLLKTEEMYHKTLYIDFSQIRRLSNLIAQKAPAEIREINVLEQQISEIIKNAVKHGNQNDKSKAIKIWFSFSTTDAHLIVEDEGRGFQELETWNEFYKRRLECYEEQDFDEMMNYLAFRTEHSDEGDGGNAMFAAVEYWNDGVAFSSKRNKVGVRRTFA
jgi:serine/threonine-protein kinase RsbW